MRSIRSKLVLTFGAFMILALGIVVAYTAVKLRDQAIENARISVRQSVRNTAWRCKAVLDQGMVSARIIARVVSGVIKNSDEETVAVVNKTLEQAMRDNSSVVSAFIWRQKQCPLEKESEATVTEEGVLWLRDSAQGLRKHSLETIDFFQEEWCEHKFQATGGKVTDIFEYSLGGESEFVFAVLMPLQEERESRKRFIGLLFSAEPLQEILNDTKKTSVGMEAKSTLLSWYGTIAASGGNPDMRGKSMELLRPYCNLGLKNLQAGKRSELDALNYIGYRVPVPVTGVDSPWSLGIRVPSSLLFQPAEKLVKDLVGIGMGLILLGMLAIVYGASQIADPIRKLSEITRRVAKGQLDQEIPISGKDEIGELAEDFRAMLAARKETFETLSQQQQSLAAIFDRAPVGMALVDADLRMAKINREAASLMGYRAKTAKNRLPGEVMQCKSLVGSGVGCGDTEECGGCLIRQTLEEVFKTGHAVRGRQGRFVQESGIGQRSFWLEINADVITLAGESQAILTIVNATEHHEDKVKLESNEKLLATILDRLPVGMVLINTSNHTISRVNPYAASMIGAAEGQILGKTCHNYICPAERGKCPITDLGNQVEDAERVLLTAFGQELPIIKTVVPVTLEGTDYLLETFVDISDMKKMEEALRRAKQAAEASLESAETYSSELEVANDELDKALIAARQASVAKSEFLANMSHEIRTPMNGIIGFTDILMEMDLAERPREFLNLIKLSADRLLRLINDILDFSKIEAGRLDLEYSNFHFRKFLDEVLSVFWVQAKDKGLDLEWTVDEEIPDFLLGDAGRIGQVLTNLVGNAIKFTDDGEVQVAVHLQMQEQGQVYLAFEVKDSGIGILPEKQKVIFEEFAQADGSHTRKYGGTGLGLAISSKLVAMMGGRLWVESNAIPARRAGDTLPEGPPGSTFHFTVTLSQSIPSDTRMDNFSLSTEEQMFATSTSVLLAEDDEVNRIFIEELLKGKQCQVVAVEDGAEVLEALKKKHFDLILMDIQMPKMDGIQAIKHIREMEEKTGQHIPVIALTAHAMADQREKSLYAGMDDYLTKPVDVDALFAVMKKYV